jgi:hypothetical protein
MRHAKQARRKVVGLGSIVFLLVVGTMFVASTPVGAQSATTTSAAASCPVLSLANPSPGDTLVPGGLVISGLAWDPSVSQGSGIERVDLFLGRRDQGGTILGSAVPGASGSDPRAFSVEVQIPNSMNRGTDFAAYAISNVSGHETGVAFPIFVGTPERTSATPTPVPTTETQFSTCPTAPLAGATNVAINPPVAVGTPGPAVPAPSMPGTTAAAPGTECPVLSLANPSPGDSILSGGLVISGLAFDPSSTSGSGIQSVQLFLGPRDEGGLILGTAVPGSVAGSNPNAFTIQVTIPNSLNRGVDFAAYAMSVTGQETAITFPIFVGVPESTTGATPTPIPTTQTVTNTCGHHM